MMATNLVPQVNQALGDVLIDLQLTLLNHRRIETALEESAAIVSGVPHVNVASGRGEFAGRRRRLTLRSGQGRLEVLARTRPLPQAPEPDRLCLRWGVDTRRRRIPVVALDPDTLTAHVLVDLEDVAVLEASGDPAELAASLLFREPFEELLSGAAAPTVGPEVGRAVRWLMSPQRGPAPESFRQELSMLERFAVREPLPGAMMQRLRRLRRALGLEREAAAGEPSTPAEVGAAEVERLTRLVSDRACAWLRFGRTRIEGLINPGVVGRQLRFSPRLFRLELGISGLEPVLRFWSVGSPAPGGSGECLVGSVGEVLQSMDEDADVYGLVDTVLNFRESAKRGLVPVRRPSPRRRLEMMMASLF